MKIKILLLAFITLLFVQCSDENDIFLITKTNVGLLTKDTKINEVEALYANDSVVSILSKENFLAQGGNVEIYEKGGAKLMLLQPKNEGDPESTISNIQIFDPRFKTDKGLNPNSTFKDLKANYTISSIQSTMLSIVISLEETDVYVTIDRSSLPENARNDFSTAVEVTQIPDDAIFKYFMVGWEDID